MHSYTVELSFYSPFFTIAVRSKPFQGQATDFCHTTPGYAATRHLIRRTPLVKLRQTQFRYAKPSTLAMPHLTQLRHNQFSYALTYATPHSATPHPSHLGQNLLSHAAPCLEMPPLPPYLCHTSLSYATPHTIRQNSTQLRHTLLI